MGPEAHKEIKTMLTAGILSDTHASTPTQEFIAQCKTAFGHCDVIIHAGDLTDISILSIFEDKQVYGVSGNMCNHLTSKVLPQKRRFDLGGYSIGLTHGAGPRHNIEERVFEMFPDVDCIVFGHTHTPTCHKYGEVLLINPGSFQNTGPYGAPGTYAILKIDESGLEASIHNVPDY